MTQAVQVQVFLEDADAAPVERVSVTLSRFDETIELAASAPGRFGTILKAPGPYHLSVKPAGRRLQGEERDVVLNPGPNPIFVSLGEEGAPFFIADGGPVYFRPREDAFLLALRNGPDSRERLPVILAELELKQIDLPAATPGEAPTQDDLVAVALPDGATVAGASGLIERLTVRLGREGMNSVPALFVQRGKGRPQGLTNRLAVRFTGEVDQVRAIAILEEFHLRVLRTLAFAGNAFLAEQPGAPDYGILDIAAKLNAMKEVVYAEPDLLSTLVADAFTPNDTLWANLTHLPLINCDDAWDTLDDIAVALRGGSPDICIAVFDPDGVAPDHPELTANLTDGAPKLLTSFNFRTMTAQTVAGLGSDHGTQCAGTATAAFDNNRGIAGVAPNCRLIGARLPNPATGIEMADAFIWAAGLNAGNTNAAFPAVPAQPADVITNSWGVTNGALSNALRDAVDFLTVYGRNGRGCVVVFSTGNLGHVQFSNIRRFAAYQRTLAVGASIGVNPTSPLNSLHADPSGNSNNLVAVADSRSFYNPFGPEMDIVAPSHTAYDMATGALIDPTTSCMRVGTGALDGCPGAATCFDYGAAFGGTSHAAPSVAGAAALVLSVDPGLNWIQVRDILRTTAVRIDNANANPIGQYVDNDGDGVAEFSQWYGFGRLDVDAAVIVARDGAFSADVVVRENLADVGTVPSPGWHASSPDIWVRQTDDPIPVLAYGAAPPHENAVRNQNNFVFCRLRNFGAATASQVFVRAMICHYPGFEFRYPQEFIPSVRPGGPVPNPLVPGTYLIGEVRVDDLLPGEDRIVKMTWPAALVPPTTVNVLGNPVNWHPCLLLEASPHDGPVAPPASAIDIRRFNNICHRNITIDDPAGGDLFTAMVAGSLSEAVRSLVVDRSRLAGDVPLFLRFAAAGPMRQLLATVEAGRFETGLEPLGEDDDKREPVAAVERGDFIRMGSATTLEIPLRSRRSMQILVAAGSRIFLPAGTDSVTVGIDTLDQRPTVRIDGRGVVELPVILKPGELVVLEVAAPGAAKFGRGEVRLTQRRADGELSAGYALAI